MQVNILGNTLGKCYNTYIKGDEDEVYITYQNFKPNKNIYKIFPDFPKEISDISYLKFDITKNQITLWTHNTKKSWEKTYIKTIKLTTFKGDNNA